MNETLQFFNTSNVYSVPFEVVSKQQCLDYVSHEVTMNYVLLGIILLMGLSFILFNYREALLDKFFPQWRMLQVAKQLQKSDPEEMNKIGNEAFNNFFGIENEETKEELKLKQVDLPIPKDKGED